MIGRPVLRSAASTAPARERVWMEPAVATIGGRRLEYAVSDNAGAPGPWAVNIHGFFAGGGMYWRESARLAGLLGWRLVNPSLPAFGGSEPLPWDDLDLAAYARVVVELLDELGVERAVLLGHSMGGVVALKVASDHPERVLGIVYRDGAAPGSWKARRGVLARLASPLAPDLGAALELGLAAAADVPDLAWGRLTATVRGVLPDARRNLRSFARTFPVAAMLFSERVDHLVDAVRELGVPVLPMAGRYDRLVPPETARAFGERIGQPVVWVSGGHSWMLPRPVTQARVLLDHPQGQAFLAAIASRPAGRSRRRGRSTARQ